MRLLLWLSDWFLCWDHSTHVEMHVYFPFVPCRVLYTCLLEQHTRWHSRQNPNYFFQSASFCIFSIRIINLFPKFLRPPSPPLTLVRWFCTWDTVILPVTFCTPSWYLQFPKWLLKIVHVNIHSLSCRVYGFSQISVIYPQLLQYHTK